MHHIISPNTLRLANSRWFHHVRSTYSENKTCFMIRRQFIRGCMSHSISIKLLVEAKYGSVSRPQCSKGGTHYPALYRALLKEPVTSRHKGARRKTRACSRKLPILSTMFSARCRAIGIWVISTMFLSHCKEIERLYGMVIYAMFLDRCRAIEIW